jgi:uncharacterized membrane protein YqjE
MSEDAQREDGAATLRGSLARLSHALLGLVRTRVELASIEFSEERARVGRQLALLIAGVGCLLFAVMFTAVGVIVYFWDTYRMTAVTGVVLVFGVAGAFLLWRRAELAQTAPAPFAASLAELDKDRTALARSFRRPPSS